MNNHFTSLICTLTITILSPLSPLNYCLTHLKSLIENHEIVFTLHMLCTGASHHIIVNETNFRTVPFICASLRYIHYIKVKAAIEASKTKMFLFVLCLSISSLYSYPASSIDQSDPPCDTLKSFEQSLEIASHSCSLCLDSEVKSEIFSWIPSEFIFLVIVSAECTSASLELLKTCLDGIKVDPECYKELHKVSVISRTS